MNNSTDDLVASFDSSMATPMMAMTNSTSNSRNASSSGVANLGVPVLMRASQPRVGLTGARSVADEALLRFHFFVFVFV